MAITNSEVEPHGKKSPAETFTAWRPTVAHPRDPVIPYEALILPDTVLGNSSVRGLPVRSDGKRPNNASMSLALSGISTCPKPCGATASVNESGLGVADLPTCVSALEAPAVVALELGSG
jgi:hypothetical protein